MNPRNKTIAITLICIFSIAVIVAASLLIYLVNKPQETVVNNIPVEETPREEVIPPIESAEYEIVRDDVSFDNAEKDLHVSQYFERVVLNDDNPNIDKINDEIQKYADKFILEAQENEAFVTDEEYITGRAYYNHASAEITKNSDGILSIKMTVSKYLGGVQNQMDYYGLSFDLNTGEKLDISEYLGMSRSDAEKFIKEETAKRLEDGYNTKVLDNYKLDKFKYYLSDTHIFVCFDTYEIAPGAAGSVVVEIPVPAENEL